MNCNKHLILFLGLTTLALAKPSDGLSDERTTFTQKSATHGNGYSKQLSLSNTPKELADGIKVSSLDHEGIDESMIETVITKIADGHYQRIDSFLLLLDGKLCSENYFTTDGTVDSPHYQMSITKSVVSLAYGRALTLGIIHPPESPIIDDLSRVNRSTVVPGAQEITYHDALSMCSGLRYPKKMRFDSSNYAQQLLSSSAPVNETRGKMKYQGTDPDLILEALAAQIKQPLPQWIEDELLIPLGIDNYRWEHKPNGTPKGGAGLHLRSRDMAKLGLLIRNHGKWNGQQLIASDYINQMVSSHTPSYGPHSYGYFWWQHSIEYKGTAYEVISARGAGGQFIFWQPELDLLAIFTSTNKGEVRRKPFEIFENYILPSRVNASH